MANASITSDSISDQMYKGLSSGLLYKFGSSVEMIGPYEVHRIVNNRKQAAGSVDATVSFNKPIGLEKLLPFQRRCSCTPKGKHFLWEFKSTTNHDIVDKVDNFVDFYADLLNPKSTVVRKDLPTILKTANDAPVKDTKLIFAFNGQCFNRVQNLMYNSIRRIPQHQEADMKIRDRVVVVLWVSEIHLCGWIDQLKLAESEDKLAKSRDKLAKSEVEKQRLKRQLEELEQRTGTKRMKMN